jgi:hypothetical protein
MIVLTILYPNVLEKCCGCPKCEIHNDTEYFGVMAESMDIGNTMR